MTKKNIPYLAQAEIDEKAMKNEPDWKYAGVTGADKRHSKKNETSKLRLAKLERIENVFKTHLLSSAKEIVEEIQDILEG